MMTDWSSTAVPAIGPGFLDEVCVATTVVAACGAVAALATGHPIFAYSFALAAGVDTWLAHLMARHGRHVAAEHAVAVGRLLTFGIARFCAKVGVIVFAWYLPAVLDFWGTVIGALAYDTTLMVAGSGLAITRSFKGGG